MAGTTERRPGSRSARAATLALAAVAVAVVSLLACAGAAHAAVWVIPASDRAFPDTLPGPAATIAIDAARNESEGAQVVLAGDASREVTFSWADGSDPLITGNTQLHQVYYVNITQPTDGLTAVPGLYPDPLIPKAFGTPIPVPYYTTSFYLRTHVPPDAAPGDRTATLIVQNGVEAVAIPFTLHVWPFGWQKLSTRTGFNVNPNHIKRSVAGSSLDWNDANARRQVMLATYTMLAQYGISSLAPLEEPDTAADGSFDAAALQSALAPYLDQGGLGLNATRIPWIRTSPWVQDKNYGPSSPQLMNYLTEVCAVYKRNGWQDQAYAYIMDETTTRETEKTAELYARTLHAASARSGYRLEFLLTDDPRPTDLGGVKQANTFLFDDVDIWGVRYFYFFGRVPALQREKAAGKQVWWYPYYNEKVAKLPNFVIEKPNTDQRVWGWLMEQWDVDGLINWALNRWVSATSSSTYRDPYQDPLTWKTAARQANGDSSLIYPGYYPAYGLTDPYAPPVSSLRLEALRDGLEDREYLKYAERLPGGSQVVARQLAAITQFPYPIEQKNVFRFPLYSDDPADYVAARLEVGRFIEVTQAGMGPKRGIAGAAEPGATARVSPALVSPAPARWVTAARGAAPAAPPLLALQRARLTGGQPSAYQRQGAAVALDGDTALVAAPDESAAGRPYAGAVSVFVRSAGGWSLAAELVAPDPASGDGFGFAVALDGDTAVVGAENRTVGGKEHAGAAYVFVRSGGTWSLQAELTASGAAVNDWSGSSVALDGDTVIVGAPGRTVGGRPYAGAAYVFQRSGGVWTQQAELTAADGAFGDEFGRAVALSGGTALIGAENRDAGAVVDAGAVYVFAGAGAGWYEQTRLVAPDPSARAGFGSALAVSGGTALVGAGGATAGGLVNCGAAYVYTTSGWSLQAQLADPGRTAGDWFGCSVALAGDRLVVGAWGATVTGRLEAGAAHVFDRAGAGWRPVATVAAADAADGDTLGWSVAVQGDTVIAGAPGRTLSGRPLAGAAYVHKLVLAPSLSLSVRPETVKAGRSVLLDGIVTNAVTGAESIQIWRKQGSRMTLLKTLKTVAGGVFSWSTRPKQAGTWAFVATYKAGGQTFRSPTATVTVKAVKKDKKDRK